MVQGTAPCRIPTLLREFCPWCFAMEYKRAQKQTPLSVPVLLPQNPYHDIYCTIERISCQWKGKLFFLKKKAEPERYMKYIYFNVLKND